MSALKRRVNWVMVDYRCPRCDRCVIGENAVCYRARKPSATTCQWCKHPVVVKWDDDDDLEEMHSWYFDTPPRKRTATTKDKSRKPTATPKSKRRKSRALRSSFLLRGDWSRRSVR
jgi:hypothetical protein